MPTSTIQLLCQLLQQVVQQTDLPLGAVQVYLIVSTTNQNNCKVLEVLDIP